jgi:hypothetical protein
VSRPSPVLVPHPARPPASPTTPASRVRRSIVWHARGSS